MSCNNPNCQFPVNNLHILCKLHVHYDKYCSEKCAAIRYRFVMPDLML